MKLKLAVTNSCNQVLKIAHNIKTSRWDNISRSTYTLDLALWNLWKISSIKKITVKSISALNPLQ